MTLDDVFGEGSDVARARFFCWLTRNGMGPKFGSRPIGWYQQTQCAAFDIIEKRAKYRGAREVRVRNRCVQSLSPNGIWEVIGTCEEIRAEAERVSL